MRQKTSSWTTMMFSQEKATETNIVLEYKSIHIQSCFSLKKKRDFKMNMKHEGRSRRAVSNTSRKLQAARQEGMRPFSLGFFCSAIILFPLWETTTDLYKRKSQLSLSQPFEFCIYPFKSRPQALSLSVMAPGESHGTMPDFFTWCKVG